MSVETIYPMPWESRIPIDENGCLCKETRFVLDKTLELKPESKESFERGCYGTLLEDEPLDRLHLIALDGWYRHWCVPLIIPWRKIVDARDIESSGLPLQFHTLKDAEKNLIETVEHLYRLSCVRLDDNWSLIHHDTISRAFAFFNDIWFHWRQCLQRVHKEYDWPAVDPDSRLRLFPQLHNHLRWDNAIHLGFLSAHHVEMEYLRPDSYKGNIAGMDQVDLAVRDVMGIDLTYRAIHLSRDLGEIKDTDLEYWRKTVRHEIGQLNDQERSQNSSNSQTRPEPENTSSSLKKPDPEKTQNSGTSDVDEIQESMEDADSGSDTNPDTIPDNTPMSAKDWARLYNEDSEALRKRLERLRSIDHTCYIEVDAPERSQRDAKYLYYHKAVKSIIKTLIVQRTSNERQKKKGE